MIDASIATQLKTVLEKHWSSAENNWPAETSEQRRQRLQRRAERHVQTMQQLDQYIQPSK
jgi:hypothetical protein